MAERYEENPTKLVLTSTPTRDMEYDYFYRQWMQSAIELRREQLIAIVREGRRRYGRAI